jgi:hypothetical protein
MASGQNSLQLRQQIPHPPHPKPPASALAPNGADHRKSAGALLIEETNALVDAYAQILERTLTSQGRIKPEEARSLLVTAYIQRSKLSFAA